MVQEQFFRVTRALSDIFLFILNPISYPALRIFSGQNPGHRYSIYLVDVQGEVGLMESGFGEV